MSLTQTPASPGLAVRAGSFFRLRSMGSSAQPIVFTGTIIDLFGNRSQVTIRHTTSSDRSGVSTNSVQINTVGWLTSGTVEYDGGSTIQKRGVIFAVVDILPAYSGTATIISGWLHAFNNPSFPGRLEWYREGPGALREISPANPGANAELTSTAVPTSAVWKLRSVTALMTQGGTQTPRAALKITDGTNTIALYDVGFTVAASTNVQHTWSAGAANNANNVSNGNGVAGIGSDIYLPAGYAITSLTTGLGANSTWTAEQIIVEETFEQ